MDCIDKFAVSRRELRRIGPDRSGGGETKWPKIGHRLTRLGPHNDTCFIAIRCLTIRTKPSAAGPIPSQPGFVLRAREAAGGALFRGIVELSVDRSYSVKSPYFGTGDIAASLESQAFAIGKCAKGSDF
jgi:hypothetical protein